LSGVLGAGNDSDTCGWYASVSPPEFVPQAFARDVAELSFDTDPKFDLINDFAPCAAP
jgi:hypothetical protein